MVCDHLLPVALVDVEAFAVPRTAVDGGEAVGLVDGDEAQLGEDRVAVGLGAQEVGPGDKRTASREQRA